MENIWFRIPFYDSETYVRKTGEVKSITYFSKVGRREKNISTKINYGGYPIVMIRHKGKQKTVRIHRLLAIMFIPNPFKKPHVNHIDGNKENYALENLEWCTRSENMKHAYKIGLKKPTDNSNYSHVLNKKYIKIIKRLIQLGVSKEIISKAFLKNIELIEDL